MRPKAAYGRDPAEGGVDQQQAAEPSGDVSQPEPNPAPF